MYVYLCIEHLKKEDAKNQILGFASSQPSRAPVPEVVIVAAILLEITG